MSSRCFDILMVSDFRLIGGSTHSIAQEIRAQAAAGYTTGLMQFSTMRVRRPRPLDPAIQRCIHDGLAELVLPDQPVRCALLLGRLPAAFRERPPVRPGLDADVRVLVANQAPLEESRTASHYSIEQVAAVTDELFGGMTWAPIGPLIRRHLERSPVPVQVLPDDWVNIASPSGAPPDRRRPVSDRPVLGRHSRNAWQKWPASAHEILSAYPTTGEVEVRILGGADAPAGILGGVPPQWTVHPYGSVPVADFLRGIDYWVYYHHPLWVEAFGRAVLDALSSGCVAILPEDFRELFGDACVYGPPNAVLDHVRRLHGDWSLYREQSERGSAALRERFSPASHVNRVEALIGRPARAAHQPIRRRDPRPRRMLLVSSNGSGMGHLTRQLAIARRLPAGVEPVFFTLSTAFGVLAAEGHPVEYLPSVTTGGFGVKAWRRIFASRLRSLLTTYDAELLVYDGQVNDPTFAEVHEDFPDVPFVWCRRGMWRRDLAEDLKQRLLCSKGFDHVLEPGDAAEANDVSRHWRSEEGVHRVEPITLTQQTELLPRQEAAAALGLDPDQPAVLLAISQLDKAEERRLRDLAVAELQERAIQFFEPQESVGNPCGSAGQGPARTMRYPVAPYLGAFDFAVAAAGYNTFHELLLAGLPAVYVPKRGLQFEDQEPRAAFAEAQGAGILLRVVGGDGLRDAVARLCDPGVRAGMRQRVLALAPRDGAEAAADFLVGLMPARASGHAGPSAS